MKDKFYTLQDLINTRFKMYGAYSFPDVDMGEKFLQPKVINMWDCTDYSDYYTYMDGRIMLVVSICEKVNEKYFKTKFLKKDLSNIEVSNAKEKD